MLLGLETFSYHLAFSAGKMDVFTYVERCAALGLDGVQLNVGHLDPSLLADNGRVRELRDVMAARGLFVEVDASGTDPMHLANMLRLSRDLGADVLRTYVSCGGDFSRELAQAPRQLRAVVPMCRDFGIRIALENHEHETSQDVLDIVHRVDSECVGTHVDTGNSMMVWEEPTDAVRAMAPLAVSTHFKDHIVVVEEGHPLVVGVTLGRGSIDCLECFRILAEESPLDRLIIEVCYGYSASFRRPQAQGAGGRLGEGTFRVVDGPLDPALAVSHPERVAPQELQQLVTWQEQSVLQSIEYVRSLNAEWGGARRPSTSR